MGIYEDRAKLLWSLGGGEPVTISANGNSGTWGDVAPASFPSSAISMGAASDFQLMVWLTGKTATPVLTVQLGYYDSLGHLFAPSALQIPNTSFSGLTLPGGVALNAGVRAGSGGSATYFAFPEFGQVSWTISGGTYTGVNIELWGK